MATDAPLPVSGAAVYYRICFVSNDRFQVELAMLEYRLTRGPRASGGEGDSGAGFRGPGETKVETDKRVIKDKIVLLQREIATLGSQRDQHRKSRWDLSFNLFVLVIRRATTCKVLF
jgi:GTP-binding protein HflX